MMDRAKVSMTARSYGKWAGNPRGYKEDVARCAAQTFGGPWSLGDQCGRKRGHGTDGLLCKQHARMISEGRYVNVPSPSTSPENKSGAST